MRKFLIAMLLLPSLALASATDDLLERLSGLNSMAGGFDQVVLGKDGTKMQTARGSMEVARGNRFYWHTEMPYEQLAVSDGKTVWVYDVDLEQVVVRPLGAEISKTPALLFGGEPARVAKAFTITEQDRQGDSVTYRLKPKASDPLFDTLDVTFNGNKPASMRLEDALGQKTVIDFRGLKPNQAPRTDRFHFEPPAGTDVIRQP